MPRSQLGDSWDGISDESADDGDGDYRGRQSEEVRPEQRRKANPRRVHAAADRSPEPELIMPSLDEDTLSSSRYSSPSKRIRTPRTPKSPERTFDSRQRTRGRATEKRSATVTETISSPKKSLPSTSHPPQDFFETTMNHVGAIFSWALSVFGQSLRILKTPIAYGLAVWMLFTIGIMTRNLVTNSIYASFSPLCSIPGVSVLGLPFCPINSGGGKPTGPPEFEQLMSVQSKFEDVLEQTAGGASLPLDMKRGEASIRDLRQLVKFSQLYSK